MTLLKPEQLHAYQRQAVAHMWAYPDSMLWLQMGLGKTPVTLTSIVQRMKYGQVNKVLIFGPLRVVQTVWEREARKWEHTQHLAFSVMCGTKQDRERALFRDADIYLTNYENMNWLAQELDHYYIGNDDVLPFQMVVYDEVSKLANSTALRMKGGNRDKVDRRGDVHKVKIIGWRKMVDQFKYRVGLTGTPASNGYLDLFGQFLAVDGGERLGQYVTGYRDAYFQSDYMGWSYKPTEIGKQYIESKISDITLKMDAKDYLDLPAVKITDLMVDLPDAARRAYIEMEKKMFAELDSGAAIEVFSQNSISNKLLQFCLAEGTEVLTDKGWKRIEEFEDGDKVWDGHEWANVYSLCFQGCRETIELNGVWVTPDHKVLTTTGWKEAQEIVNGDACFRFNRTAVRIPNCFEETREHNHEVSAGNLDGEMCMRKGVCSDRCQSEKSEQTEREIVRVQARRRDREANRITRNVQKSRRITAPRVCGMDKHEVTLPKFERQGLPKLRGARYRRVRRMVRLVRNLLGGHGGNLSVTSVYRTSEQQWKLLQGQLSLGYKNAPSQQQKGVSLHHDTVRKNDSHTGSTTLRIKQQYHIRKNSQGMGGTVPDVTVKIQKTYDLLNVGTRNQFVVRGNDGPFIVHNCNGSPFLNSGTDEYESLHDAKLDALEDVLEEAGGSPVLCSYTYKPDAERIMKRFKKYKPVNLTQVKSKDTGKVIDDWNSGKIKLLVGHPASTSHGLDGLQQSGHIIVWFGCNWSLELYEQLNARIDRQGQQKAVSIVRILCRDTVDMAVADALERKTDDQEGLKAAIQRYRARMQHGEISFL